jgi:hypothetical protein
MDFFNVNIVVTFLNKDSTLPSFGKNDRKYKNEILFEKYFVTF